MFGDYLLHGRLQEQALKKQDYAWFFKNLKDLLALVDFRTLNLEGPAAAGVDKFGQQQKSVNYFDGNVLTSYPMFNYHESALSAIKQAGFDFVTTANNHALDRRALGVDKTIDGLNENQLSFAGTRKQTQSQTDVFLKFVSIKNFKIGIISCTEHTNGIPDKADQVLYCGKHMALIQSLIKESKKDRTVDGVMVLPHWGEENQHQPEEHQRAWARKFIDAGSFAVIGSHPHVIQTMESYQSVNGNQGVIFYSLGNFVSGQVKLNQKVTVGLVLTLVRSPEGQVKVQKLAYIPLYMDRLAYQVFPIETVTVVSAGNKKSPRDIEMALGDQLLTRLLGEKNKIYFSKALTSLKECQL